MRNKKSFSFDEETDAQLIYNRGCPNGSIDYSKMYLIAKFIRQTYDYGEIRLEKELIRFCKTQNKKFNPVLEADALKKWVRSAMRYDLRAGPMLCRMKTRGFAAAAALLLAFAAAAAARAETLTILHVNDFHGALEPVWIAAGKPEEGGAARLAAVVAAERTPTTLFVAAGDLTQGSNHSNLFAGRPVIEVFNLMGLDASAVGNHEFDNGQAALAERAAEARFPFLAANIAGPGPWLPSLVRQVGGVRVALFRLTTEEACKTRGAIPWTPI